METVQILSLSLRQQYFLCLTGESREAYLHGSSTNKCLLHQRKFGARALAWLGMQHKQNSLGETEEELRLQTQLCSSWLRALPEGRTCPGVISASERSVQRSTIPSARGTRTAPRCPPSSSLGRTTHKMQHLPCVCWTKCSFRGSGRALVVCSVTSQPCGTGATAAGTGVEHLLTPQPHHEG